jgi:hypothetical protein
MTGTSLSRLVLRRGGKWEEFAGFFSAEKKMRNVAGHE